jgi:hypothetical protein
MLYSIYMLLRQEGSLLRSLATGDIIRRITEAPSLLYSTAIGSDKETI